MAESLTPVDALPDGKPADPEVGIALCLSGGGYRAMLFHLGAIWRLAELGFLGSANHEIPVPDGSRKAVGTLRRISSVSGGSITSAMLALKWSALDVDSPGLMSRFIKHVADPIRQFSTVPVAGMDKKGAWQLLRDIVLPGSINDHVIAAFEKHLYGKATLQDLPDSPRFVINASNLQSGALWRFMKPYIRDWRVGEIKFPKITVAQAVAASSAFPPFLAPATFSFNEADYTPQSGGTGKDNLQRPPFTTRPVLADGGVYDNLGLETAYKRYQTLLVSNAGKPFETTETVHSDWARLGSRCINVMDNQVLSLRKRLLVGDLVSGVRTGAFWDIEQNVSVHRCPTALDCSFTDTQKLAQIGTDLSTKDEATQQRLINWGYANCDAALRGHFDATLVLAPKFPYARGVS